ncbi:MAG: ribonuclease E/G, partial [Sheuella sp.]|nr:ribonuclease E/G [Sheuella sp.]
VAAPIVAAPVVAAPSAAAPAPVIAPAAPIVAAVVAPADTAALHAIVQSAGLQWVESKPGISQAFASQTVVQVKLGREPKPAEIVSDVPLTQVETKR